jgi:hypothetical protein
MVRSRPALRHARGKTRLIMSSTVTVKVPITGISVRHALKTKIKNKEHPLTNRDVC